MTFEGSSTDSAMSRSSPCGAARVGFAIWYGGNSKAAARRPVECCDGRIPGRLAWETFGSESIAWSGTEADEALGIEHLVFDLRTSFERYEEGVEMVGTEVLPRLHRGDGRP